MPYKIIFKKKDCVGAGECAVVSPEMWKIGSDGRADLAGAKQNAKGDQELVITDEQYAKEKKAAGSCPVQCISIVKC